MEKGEGIDLNEFPPCTDETLEDSIERNDAEGTVEPETSMPQDNSNDNDILNSPTEGMSFDSGEEFAAFCHDYAYRKGFVFFSRSTSLLKEYSEKGISRTSGGTNEPRYYMMERIRFHCKMGGRKKSEGSNVTGCRVFVDGKIEDGKMKLKKCFLEHNHELDPKDSPLMPNYRSIDNATANRIVVNDRAGISIIKSYNSLVVESGGQENVSFNKKDVRNVVNCQRRKARIEGDAVALENYFKEQKEYNNEFFFSIERDDEGRLMNAFWSDPRSRSMFKDFGDIVTFDTTFLCNRYRMPFAPFVGVSHHGKSIVFAAALISHEDANTFVWVFNKWLECMGKAPQGILTDQCKAIGKAVHTVFPGIPHRLCLWHILQNASRNLGKLSMWKEIDKDLQVIVHDSLDPEEFDEAWGVMVEKFALQNNSWLTEAFEIRERWAPGHWRGTFWAGMSSTQRSEGINRFFKGYVSVETGLIQFISQYERALKDKVEDEKYLNFSSKHKPLSYDKYILAEYVYHKAYTNAKFQEVKEECAALKNINVTKLLTLGGVTSFTVEEKITKPIWKARWKSYYVKMEIGKGEFLCSCKLFEFRGILCRHIISVMEREDIECIPEKYILDRWRKDKVREYENVKVSYYDPLELERVAKQRELTQRHNYLSSLALHNEETYAMYKEHTEKIRGMLEEAVGIVRRGGDGSSWWDPSVQKVYGRRRIRPREENQAHLKKQAAHLESGSIKDPIDKRQTGRAAKNRKPNPCEKAATKKKKRVIGQEEDEVVHEEIPCDVGIQTQNSEAVNLADNEDINMYNGFYPGEPSWGGGSNWMPSRNQGPIAFPYWSNRHE